MVGNKAGITEGEAMSRCIHGRVFSWLMLRPALEPPVRPGSVEIEAGRMGRGETQEEEGQEWVEVEVIDYS